MARSSDSSSRSSSPAAKRSSRSERYSSSRNRSNRRRRDDSDSGGDHRSSRRRRSRSRDGSSSSRYAKRDKQSSSSHRRRVDEDSRRRHRSPPSASSKSRHHRNRSSSSSRTSNDSDTDHRTKSTTSKQQNILAMKEKMRADLANADVEGPAERPHNSPPSASIGRAQHSAAEAAFRSAQIESIDTDAGGDFKPATFRSSRNNQSKKAHLKNQDPVASARAAYSSHDAAIFGTAGELSNLAPKPEQPEQKKVVTTKNMYSRATTVSDSGEGLAHENLNRDPDVRWAHWRVRWSKMRQAILDGNYQELYGCVKSTA